MSDPEPGQTSGLEPGGGVRPGETPPVEGGIAETEPEPEELRRAWGPVPLAVIVTLALAMGALFVIAGVVVSLD